MNVREVKQSCYGIFLKMIWKPEGWERSQWGRKVLVEMRFVLRLLILNGFKGVVISCSDPYPSYQRDGTELRLPWNLMLVPKTC